MECINSPKVTASNLITSAMRAVNPTMNHLIQEKPESPLWCCMRNSISTGHCRPQTLTSGDGRDLASPPQVCQMPSWHLPRPTWPLSSAARLGVIVATYTLGA